MRSGVASRRLAVVPAVLGGLCGALLPASESLAACAPATGDNVTVTCLNTTINQGPGINTGYGAGNQNGLTINVQPGASVLGTSIGIDLNGNNTINNSGTISTNGTPVLGNAYGINTNGALTVVNSGTIGRTDLVIPGNNDLAGINTLGTDLVVTNTSTGVIQGTAAIQASGTPSVMTVTNSGLISGLVGGGGVGIFGDTVTLTNNASGTITADAVGVNANTATIYNYGTISAPAAGSFGTAINVNSLTLVNYASGVITGDGGAISGSFIPVATITNFGTISATGGLSTAIFGINHATITNNVGATIVGDLTAISTSTTSTVFNAGTITGVNGDAIDLGGTGNTLTIAPTSVINGNVVAGGTDTFQLGGPGTGTFDLALIGAQYQGFTTFNKVDASTWTLTGTGNQAWTVQAGRLLVDGDLSAAPGITVNPGGTLGGSGILPTTNVNGGVFAPGHANGPGAITVSGNLSFQAGSTYLVQLAPSTASIANVSGTAALAGTVLAALQPGSYVTRQYTILSAGGGFGGSKFSNLAFVPSGFGGNLTYTPTTVVLDLTAQLGQNGPLGQNQQNVANAINNFFNNGGALPPGFLNAFGGGSTALSQLSGEAATGSQQSAFQLMDQFLSFMIDPFVDGGSPIGGAGGRRMGFAAEQPELPPEIALAYAAVLKAPPRTFEQRWSVRGAAYGGYNRISGDLNGLGTHDLSARAGGFAGAVDYHVTHDTVIGVALAGGETNWGLADGLGGGRSDAFQAGAYGATRNGPAYLAGSLAYTWHAASTDRLAVAGDELTARFNAQSFGGRLESGYRWAWPMVAVTPYAAVQAQGFFLPSYRETDLGGGGFGLAFASRTATDTRSELGARFERAVTLNPTSALTLRARLAWAHDWVSDPMLSATFEMLPGASFVVNGAVPAKDSALATAGAELRLANGVSLLGKFDGQFASHANTYAGSGVLRYVW
jgi:outer membrane autotransporter protein